MVNRCEKNVGVIFIYFFVIIVIIAADASSSVDVYSEQSSIDEEMTKLNIQIHNQSYLVDVEDLDLPSSPVSLVDVMTPAVGRQKGLQRSNTMKVN